MHNNELMEHYLSKELKAQRRVFGLREDSVVDFNNDILRLANSPLPVLERNNYLWIALQNIMEMVGRKLNEEDNSNAKKYLKLLFTIASKVNHIASTIRYTDFNEEIQDDINELPDIYQSVPRVIPNQQTILVRRNDTWHHGYDIIQYKKKDKRVYDGFDMIPITFQLDVMKEFDRSNIGMWCFDELGEMIKEHQSIFLRYAFVWVATAVSKSSKEDISILLREQGYYPLFMNINILNAHKRYRSETRLVDSGLNFAPDHVTGIYQEYDYLSQKNFARYVRVPYHSYDEVDDLYDQAASHPEDVQSIYICLYRTSKDSRLAKSLIKASNNKIHLYIYIEINANGSESENWEFINSLIENGNTDYITLQFGYIGLKVHAKIGLIMRHVKEPIVHMATGNFNEETARMYTDIHKISDHEDEVDNIFNIFTELQTEIPRKLKIKDLILKEISNEIKKGPEGKIAIKCNHLVDPKVIDALYLAARNGVAIQVTARTTNLISGYEIGRAPRRIIGKFLEHERIYVFGDERNLRVYAGSGDLLFRNLHSRMEVLFRIDLDNREYAWRLATEVWGFTDS